MDRRSSDMRVAPRLSLQRPPRQGADDIESGISDRQPGLSQRRGLLRNG
jgi:hypothetical protein